MYHIVFVKVYEWGILIVGGILCSILLQTYTGISSIEFFWNCYKMKLKQIEHLLVKYGTLYMGLKVKEG